MTDLHITQWGEGEPVVMVHGSFGWGEDTFGKQRPLSDHYKLLLVDRRGFGKSPQAIRVDFASDAPSGRPSWLRKKRTGNTS
jgi:pimeloyl-ACP methyl ester carboxylesterase